MALVRAEERCHPRRRPAAVESETLSIQPARTPAFRSERQRRVKLKAFCA